MTRTKCSVTGCGRTAVAAEGMCRKCRENHLRKTMREIGPAKHRMNNLIDHYGNVGTAARMIGIARNTAQRIKDVELDKRISRQAFDLIMNHKPTTVPATMRVASQPEHVPVQVILDYANSEEGQEYIERCRAPRKYRRYMETAA